MLAFWTWREFGDILENVPGGSLARDVTAIACRIRRERPYLFNTIAPLTPPFNNMAPIVSHAIWDRVCTYFPPAAGQNPCQPFQGGQCDGVDYFLDMLDENGVILGNTLPLEGGPRGPITCIKVLHGPDGWQNSAPFRPEAFRVEGFGSAGFFARTHDTRTIAPRRDTRRFSYRLRRTDGLPDSCGNGPINVNIPPTPPSNTINMEINIGGQTRNIDVTLPELETGNWPNFQFRPVFEFDGVRVEFQPGGIAIEYPDNIAFSPVTNIGNEVNNINNNLNNIGDTVNNIDNTVQNVSNTVNSTNQTVNNISNTLQQEFNELNDQLAIDIQTILDAIERCCCKEGVTLASEIVSGGTAGGRFALPDKTVAVLFELTLPAHPNTPTQEGSGSAERVYHWGSYAIGYAPGADGERIPLQWQKQAVAVAPYATNVTIWPTYDNIGSIRAFYEESPV